MINSLLPAINICEKQYGYAKCLLYTVTGTVRVCEKRMAVRLTCVNMIYYVSCFFMML